MSTLVVLACAAAVIGTLGFALSTLARHGRSRHSGGSTALARALLTAVPLAVATVALLPLRDRTELVLSALALGWSSLPWLVLTRRLSAWGHAAWSSAASASAYGLLHLAWLTTTAARPIALTVGAWALWVLAVGAAVLFLGFTREAAAVATSGGGRSVPPTRGRSVRAQLRLPLPQARHAGVWAVGGAAAVALGLLVQQSPDQPAAAAADAPRAVTPATAPTTVPPDPTTPAPTSPASTATRPATATAVRAAPTTSAGRPSASSSVARSAPRASTPRVARTTPAPTTTTAPRPLVTVPVRPPGAQTPPPTGGPWSTAWPWGPPQR
jgi:hypothetical protein